MGIYVLDSSDNNDEYVTALKSGRYSLFIPKLYDPAYSSWTKNALSVAHGEGIPVQVYSADVSFGWDATTHVMAALGLDPKKCGVWIDWWEYRVSKYGWSSARASAEVHQGVDDAHLAGCKAGGYGSEFAGWPAYAGIPFDADWVANYNSTPRRHYDLDQYGRDVRFGDYSALRPGLMVAEALTMLTAGTPAPKWPGVYLKLGVRHPSVITWKKRLTQRGWNGMNLASDIFGTAVDHCTRGFQTNNHLQVDGIVGPTTWNAAW